MMISVQRFLTPEQCKESVRIGDKTFDTELRACYNDLFKTRGRFRGRSVKAIALCGPTCAGKTTTAKKLTKLLEENGKRVHTISIDDFFIPLPQTISSFLHLSKHLDILCLVHYIIHF